MDVPEGSKIRKSPCESCPFGRSPHRIDLGEEKIREIKHYLSQGDNHFCHSDSSNHTICRGGRRFQLQVFCTLGIISEPTDEALREAMRKAGVEPRTHI